MRLRTTAAGALVLATSVAGIGAVPATAADSCLGDPWIGSGFGAEIVPQLTTTDEAADFYLYGATLATCPDVSLTVQRPNGSQRTVVDLNRDVPDRPPDFPSPAVAGTMTFRLADGAGRWVITKVTSGATSRALNHPFAVNRGSTTTLEQPATVTAPAKTTVTGVVRRYTPTGALEPAAGWSVAVRRATVTLATATTDATGRYRAQVGLTRNTELGVTSTGTPGYDGSGADRLTAHVRAGLPKLSASPTAYVNQWWKVTGQVAPGYLMTHLKLWNGTAWQSTGSYGPAAADGTFARWWKPTAPGTYRLRLELGTATDGLDNTPLFRELTITVRSLQTVPTYLSGFTGPTSSTVIRKDTKMSSFGHLKVRYNSGTVGPYANQLVDVEVRSVAEPTYWFRMGRVRTSSNGYFYTNWNMPYDVEDAQVRYVYTSPYVTIKSAELDLGVFDVQP